MGEEEPRPLKRVCVRRHRMVHTQRKPLSCPPCNRRPNLSRVCGRLALFRILGHFRPAGQPLWRPRQWPADRCLSRLQPRQYLGRSGEAYLHSGEQHFLDTILQAHDDLLANQCFATGGFGPDEQLLPRAAWRRKTDYSHNSFETQCGAFAVFKLCKYLMTITGNARYGDWIERIAYNGIAATIPMSSDGLVFYYSDYSSLGGVKRNHSDAWSCCTGTRPMALADLHDLIYFHDQKNLYVNLFVPSTLVWTRPGGAVRVKQRTRFPETESTELTIALKTTTNFGLMLRAPGWLRGPISVSVNGQAVDTAVDRHGWVAIHRNWQDGDRITVRLPMRFEVRPLDSQSPFPAVIMRGPVALAVRSTGHNPGDIVREHNLDHALVASEGEPLGYHVWRDSDLLVRPFYVFKQGEPYSLYLDPTRFSHRAAQFSGAGWHESEAFRYNDRPGSSVAFRFDGRGIRWIGYRFDDAGIAELSVDGKPVSRVDQYASERNLPFEWRKEGLSAGSHLLTITILDEKPERSKGHFVNVAGFEVIP